MDSRTRDALDRNYRLASGEMFAAAERGESFETSDLHCVTCGYPLAEFNWAFLKVAGTRPERTGERSRESTLEKAIERAAERAERYFGERSFPFRFIVRSDQAASCAAMLEARGHLRQPKTTPGMAIEPLRKPPSAPASLRIVRVESDASLADFQRTAFSGFGMPVAFGARFLTGRLLDSPESALLVGYVGDEAVATSMLTATGRIAGVYWVATLEAHRRRGYAEALTWAALDAGRALGCTIGSLQATELGRPVYARMGFEQTAEYVQFERSVAS